MRKNHLIYDFIRMSVTHKIQTGRSVENEMRNNPAFSEFYALIDELKIKTNILECASMMVVNGGKIETMIHQQALDEWEHTMRKVIKVVIRLADFNTKAEPVLELIRTT